VKAERQYLRLKRPTEPVKNGNSGILGSKMTLKASEPSYPKPPMKKSESSKLIMPNLTQK